MIRITQTKVQPKDLKVGQLYSDLPAGGFLMASIFKFERFDDNWLIFSNYQNCEDYAESKDGFYRFPIDNDDNDDWYEVEEIGAENNEKVTKK